MVSALTLFKNIIMIQLFYSIIITILAHSMPVDTLDFVTMFSDAAESINLEDTSATVQASVQRQTNIPVIELGALVFYSGNILIDLLLNFAFAIPEMIGLLIAGISMLLNIDNDLVVYVELFASVIITITYFLLILQMLIGVRSGRLIE